MCSKICTGKFKIAVILASLKYHSPRCELSEVIPLKTYKFPNILDQFLSGLGSGPLDLSHFCPHIGVRHFQKFPKFLSGQSSGISGFSSNFCPHKDQAFDVNFPGPDRNDENVLPLVRLEFVYLYLLAAFTCQTSKVCSVHSKACSLCLFSYKSL